MRPFSTMQIPEPMNSTVNAVYEAIEKRTDQSPRSHLGASQIGHGCDRFLWLSFRWAVREKFSGRMLRLFRRGQEEEQYVVADLRAAGMDVVEADPDTGRQFNFGVGHFGGSMDGIINSGVPESPKTPHVLEIKTHSLKSFKDLVKHGVEQAKPMHYAQMQIYMHARGLERALYFAVCKDNDELYTECVKLSKPFAERLFKRAEYITTTDRMPEPLSNDATWYECKFCPASGMCFSSKPTRRVNCRTCAKSTATADGKWHCAEWDDFIPTKAQHAGCGHHVLHPDLVPLPFEPTDDGRTIIFKVEGGKPIVNGAKECGGVPSAEFLTLYGDGVES